METTEKCNERFIEKSYGQYFKISVINHFLVPCSFALPILQPKGVSGLRVFPRLLKQKIAASNPVVPNPEEGAQRALLS